MHIRLHRFASITRISRGACIAVITLLLVGSCGGGGSSVLSKKNLVEQRSGSNALPPPSAPFWVPGEQMAWELSIRGIVGASVVLAVGKPGNVDGRKVLIVRSQVQGLGLVRLLLDVGEDVTTWVVASNSQFVYQRGEETVDGTNVVQELRVDSGGFDLLRRSAGSDGTVVRRKIPNDGLLVDVNSVLGVIRAWRAKPGMHTRLYFWHDSKIREHVWRMTGKESIKTRMGRFTAYRIDGRADRVDTKPRYYSVWISDDERRLPILVKADTLAGQGRIELASYASPGDGS